MVEEGQGMSSRQQLERILEIDRQIRALKYPNARSLAQELEVSERTIYQDRQFLVDRLGAPLAYDRKRGGWYYTDPNWALPSVLVTEGELLAFFLSVEIAKRYLGTAFEAPLRSAVEKITAGLKGQVEVSLKELQECYIFAPPSVVSVKEELLLDLYRAIQQCRQVKIRYFTASRGCWQVRVVEPYHLYNLRGDWYLIAFDHLRGEMRIFHAGRIDQWEVLSKVFTRDPQFSVEEWMAQAFVAERGEEPVEVVIKFDPYQARYIRERRWHSTQEIEELPGGGLLLCFFTGGLDEVKRWVMGYGSHAEVLAPTSLRQAVEEEIERMMQLYRKSC
ncbi:helix-turn-helix transcriptional regulator [Thermanaeromonas toyohensis]|nr:WYL domain-containing transcriptional regulator [Thermanaeromonas toyohensis]